MAPLTTWIRRIGFRGLAAGLLLGLSAGCHDSGSSGGGAPPVSDSQEAMIDLGFKLMFDGNLSRPRGIACGTCHDPFLGWGDGRPQGKGVQDNSLDTGGHNPELAVQGPRFKTILTPRNTPTVYNSHLFPNLFWDGRAGDLGHQAQFPFEAGPEMNSSWDEHILPVLQSDPEYVALFETAFGAGEPIDRVNAPKAIGAFEATISVFDTPFDDFLADPVGAPLPEDQERGRLLFFGKAGCGECHPAPLLTDFGFHNTGVPQAGTFALNGEIDLGFGKRTDITALPAGAAVEIDEPDDYCKFKTPQLRMISVTGPYMHNGAFDTLAEVIEFYDQGGGDDPSPTGTKDPRIVPLGLTAQEKADLLAFLEDALTGTEIQ